MNNIYKELTNKDNKKAYRYARHIIVESTKNNKYLSTIPIFVSMLDDDNSLIRTRGFMLICSQARWANKGEIKKVFNKMSPLLFDSKPTVVRQCLKSLHEVALFRPELSKNINDVINKINLNNYSDCMVPLIKKDIKGLLNVINIS